MAGLIDAFLKFFSNEPRPTPVRQSPIPPRAQIPRTLAETTATHGTARSPGTQSSPKSLQQTPVQGTSHSPSSSVAAEPTVVAVTSRPTVPYWQVRGWHYKGDGVYHGYFKTHLGRCHGVIKWNGPYDFGFYVHDVPEVILAGPYGGCFAAVRPGKYRVHFAEFPQDINSGIFYIETVLQGAFENGQTY